MQGNLDYLKFRGIFLLIFAVVFSSLFLMTLAASNSAIAAGGLFPKTPPGTEANVVNAHGDDAQAKLTAFALEGLINQSRAEVYIIDRPVDQEQLSNANRTINRMAMLSGANPGLRTLFKKYAGQVKKMFIYDPNKDWTFFLALMAAARQDGIPVTAENASHLTSEFNWKGSVEDFRNNWSNRIQAYDWALTNLMQDCSRKVVFTVPMSGNIPLYDYVVASRGFIFRLDFKKPDELAEVNKIFSTKGYTVGTSLMGYNGDSANSVANNYGIGYVVSDYYANGSFWSSFPNKVYHQAIGRPVMAVPGKVYVMLLWTDGDNIQFDQNGIYTLWHDPARGTVPIATPLSPSLQELNTPLLDWYYAKMTANDELIAGASGFQFIYGRDYNDKLFPAWTNLNKIWIADAGFHTACVWVTHYPSEKYSTYLRNSNLAGVCHNFNHLTGVRTDSGIPVLDEGGALQATGDPEQDVYDVLSKKTPDPHGPVFLSWSLIVQYFGEGKEGGYTKVKHIVDRLNADYPGRYVFLLPKDFFATIRNHYHLPPTPQ